MGVSLGETDDVPTMRGPAMLTGVPRLVKLGKVIRVSSPSTPKWAPVSSIVPASTVPTALGVARRVRPYEIADRDDVREPGDTVKVVLSAPPS
jgi:hypothetical protein